MRFHKSWIEGVKKPLHGGDVWDKPRGIIDFSSNVNPLGPPESVLSAVRSGLEELSCYPDSGGDDLKNALAGYTGVPQDQITLGNGSTEIIQNLVRGFLSPGDNVLIPLPTFSEYEALAKLEGAMVTNPFLGIKPDKGKILNALETVPGLVFLCNPNNPTGSYFSNSEIQKILEMAGESNTPVAVDEAYTEFSNKKSAVSLIESYENLLIIRSLTKFFSIPGLRVGYALSSPEITSYLEKLRMPWNVNHLAQLAGKAALKDEGFIAKSKDFIASEREFFYSSLKKIGGLNVHPTSANFFLIDVSSKGKSPDIKEKLLNRGLLVRDCSSFEGLGRDFIRVSIMKREENLKLLEALEEV